MHPVLRRQLQKANLKDGTLDYDILTRLISLCYEENDKERNLILRTMDLVSQELLEVNRELREQAENLRTSQERYELASKGSNDGLWDYDFTTDKFYFSDRWKTMVGLSPEDKIEKLEQWLDLIRQDHRTLFQIKWKQHLDGETDRFNIEVPVVNVEGDDTWVLVRGIAALDEKGNPTRFIGSQTDITHLKEMKKQLSFYATHDILTKLPNRLLFNDRLTQSIIEAQRNKKSVAILFVDLDRFKYVNDTYGHKAGDIIIQQAALRLEGCIRKTDTLARIGGDEFIILLKDIKDEKHIKPIAQKIIEVLKEDFNIDGKEFSLSGSVGVSLYPRDGNNAESLLSKADIAMYRSKRDGGNCFSIYKYEMNHILSKRLELESYLQKAVRNNELMLYYQPVVDIRKNEIVGCEALLRWFDEKLGWVSPQDVISIAEESDLIHLIGEWTLYEACRQNKQWQNELLQPIYVSVNLSGHQLRKKDLVSVMSNIINSTKINPKYLQIELTETTIFESSQHNNKILNELSALGASLVIDDFGTGYSNLRYLSELPISKIKIDRSFLSFDGIDSTNKEIVKALLNLAHTLNLEVTAEGVETEAQLSFLKNHYCEQVQGFLFSQALPPAEFASYLIINTTLFEENWDFKKYKAS